MEDDNTGIDLPSLNQGENNESVMNKSSNSQPENTQIPQTVVPNPQPDSINTPTTFQVRSKKRLKRSGDDASFAAINKLQKICDTAKESLKEDEFDIFGRHVASQLRNIDIVRAIEVQTEINSLLSKARIQDIKDKQRQTTIRGPQQSVETDDCTTTSSYWSNTPHSVVIRDFQYSEANSPEYEERYVEQSSESATRDLLAEALDTIR